LAWPSWVDCRCARRGLFGILGPFLYYLASPLFLFFLYYLFQNSDLRSFGEGLRSRQHFQQQLEISTTNPHDADAHYQLGLIYQKRRQYSDAIARFQHSIEIDPEQSDGHFQLGRIAATKVDSRMRFGISKKQPPSMTSFRLAMFAGTGASYLGANRLEEARAALANSSNAGLRSGRLVLVRETLNVGQSGEAHAAFGRSIEALTRCHRIGGRSSKVAHAVQAALR